MNMSKNTSKSKRPGKRMLLVLLAALLVILLATAAVFMALGGVENAKKVYYGYKTRSALSKENKDLGEPLKALGFTNIEGGKSICEHIEKFGYTGKPLDCTAILKSYQVFSDETSKTKAVTAATKLSSALKQRGWKQGNYEVGTWFKDVMSGVDYNADAYYYKYVDKTFCVLDFFVAYSNPKPPAVSVQFRCTVPEIHPPVS
jgi:hypothetical protein